MPTTTLREPWFLEGRTSVWQRAVLMSLVLGGLGLVAGLAWMISLDFLVANTGYAVDDWKYFGPALSSLIAAEVLVTLIGIPYLRWQGQSPWSIAIRCTLMAWIVATPFLGDSTVQSVLNAGCERFIVRSFGRGWLLSTLWTVELTLLCLAMSVGFFRTTWSFLPAAFISLYGVFMAYLLCMGTKYVIFVPHGLPSIFEAQLKFWRRAYPVMIGGPYFALIVIPWGIPFWFPPARELAPVDTAQG